MRPPRRRKRRRPDAPAPPPSRPAAASAGGRTRSGGLDGLMGPQHRLTTFRAEGCGGGGDGGSFKGRTITLEGVTHFDFNEHTYSLPDTQLRQGSDCDGCEGRDCVSISADVTISYSLNTRVELPSVADYPDLTTCEQRNVQNAIDTVLAPHEQEHVDALHQYDGSETVSFSATLCRNEIESRLADFVEARDDARKQAARDRSAALDPFNFTFDPSAGCEEEGETPDTAPEEEEPDGDKDEAEAEPSGEAPARESEEGQ